MMIADLLWLLALVYFVHGLWSFVRVWSDPRLSRSFVWKSLLAIALYVVHGAVGILILIYLMPKGPDAAFGGVTAFFGWIGLGTLGLLRLIPAMHAKPRWLTRFGIADVLCLLAIAGGVASAAGFI